MHVSCINRTTKRHGNRVNSSTSIFFLLSSIYIKKNVCLSVCSLCIPTPLDGLQRNFPERVSTTRGRSTSTFFGKKNEPYRCYRQSMKLTNRIAAFQKSRKLDSEGGCRPSERSSATIHMIRVPVAMLSVLHATYMTDQ